MLIDEFTIGAQLVNFLLLMWLLQRFLYKPLLAAIEQRERSLADNLRQAELAKEEAETEKNVFQMRTQELLQRRSEQLQFAKEEAEREYQRLLKMAREHADEQQQQWGQALKAEEEVFYERLQEAVQREMLVLVKKILADLAEVNLEEQIVGVFLRRLQESEDGKKFLQTETWGPIVVRSAFSLTEATRMKIKEVFQKSAKTEESFVFEVQEELLCGIEVVNGETKVSWSMASYLDAMQQQAKSFLGKEAYEV